MRMRIATLPCPGPSFTVLAGALLKANGDRHTLLSPVQPPTGSHSLFSGADAYRRQFAGRIADASWPIVRAAVRPARSRDWEATRFRTISATEAEQHHTKQRLPTAQVSTAGGCRDTAATETQIIHNSPTSAALPSVRSSPATTRGGSIPVD